VDIYSDSVAFNTERDWNLNKSLILNVYTSMFISRSITTNCSLLIH